MDKQIRDREALLNALVKLDPLFQKKMEEGRKLERRFDEMTAKLSLEQRDLAWDFIMLNEDISHHVIYLACKYMEFQSISDRHLAFSDDYDERTIQAELLAKLLNKEHRL